MNDWHFISLGWVVNNPYIWKMREMKKPHLQTTNIRSFSRSHNHDGYLHGYLAYT
jgi:hypothetical protein